MWSYITQVSNLITRYSRPVRSFVHLTFLPLVEDIYALCVHFAAHIQLNKMSTPLLISSCIVLHFLLFFIMYHRLTNIRWTLEKNFESNSKRTMPIKMNVSYPNVLGHICQKMEAYPNGERQEVPFKNATEEARTQDLRIVALEKLKVVMKRKMKLLEHKVTNLEEFHQCLLGIVGILHEKLIYKK